ncbi:MAG: hypothetical protein ACREHD_15275, partial [Pirellulales bacterium]
LNSGGPNIMTISGLIPGDDSVSGGSRPVDPAAAYGIAVTGVDDTNGTWEYFSKSANAWTAIPSGPTGVSTTNALLLDGADQVSFKPSPGFNGTVNGSATLTFQGWDESLDPFSVKVFADQSFVNLTGDTGLDTPFSTQSVMASVTVTATADAPTLTASSNLTFNAVQEDAGQNGESPATRTQVVAMLKSDASVINPGHDVEARTAPNSADGIAVTGLTGNGTWEYSTTANGALTAIPATVGNTSAFLLAGTDYITFIPTPGTASPANTPTLIFHAWDMSFNPVTAVVDSDATSVNLNTGNAYLANDVGNDTPFSTTTDTASITVTAVNDYPRLDQAANGLVSFAASNEDATSNAARGEYALPSGSSASVLTMLQ